MEKGVVISGFGGQGVMLAGELLAEAGKEEGKYVTFLPSYGPEMRGGTANCHVIVSDTTIASPIIGYPKAAIVLNLPSLDKYEPLMKKDGIIIINKTLVPREVKRDDVRVLQIDAQHVAEDLGNKKVVNMILLGAYVEIEKPVKIETLKNALKSYLTGRKAELIEVNERALEKGAEIARDFMGVK
ncbi:MAG: 2-oxoacid:ferredoxin oxidoreductase subunit gamma [Caldisericum sp. CG2_30_36_11]|jgi:2-oxoglutarate ferredoxin oxidoreductase subunit gamma|nr:2-oxoacid:ferredoxin oxidoreductase subunit gamma [Caldisericota bacterium]OIP11855.1 MAG: 2-oxoacid:ferredoxin oxidoreductase subunit gamma [Caldisericum sp. CG2_30_36_11]PIP49318.1 MAG: 2-oxoacid:ferredoxin oxidoreductase subunit gamma [Caldiserica bacterium CG23_combo_of_CG06-09_8_20_14_all_35_60]PIW10473.1 MAG: 2-oxoacid:ferredoxin oxidoreductase subunit gamma [Caldiserica bacterium CG17_big_fil_post_rev_8_21_14_2_50_35_7]